MILTFEHFTKAKAVVDKFIRSDESINVRSELIESSSEIPQGLKREFYHHLSSLFLNVLLNRIGELGPKAESRSIEARKEILSIIKSL